MKIEIARLDEVFDIYSGEVNEELEECNFKSSAAGLPSPFRQMRLYFSSSKNFYSGFIGIESVGESAFRGLSGKVGRVFSKYNSGLDWVCINNDCKGYVVERGSSAPILSVYGDRIGNGARALRVVAVGEFGAELRRFKGEEDFYSKMGLVGKVFEIIINSGLSSKRRKFPDLTLTISCI